MTSTEITKITDAVARHYTGATVDDVKRLTEAVANFPLAVVIEAVAAERAARGELFAHLDVAAVQRRCAAHFPSLLGRFAESIDHAHTIIGQIQRIRADEYCEAYEAAAGVPSRFAAAWPCDVYALSKSVQLRVEQAGRQVLNAVERMETVLITGRSGAGKTHAAAAVVNYWTSHCRSARYIVGADYAAALRQRWTACKSDRPVVNVFRQLPLLVIDNLDALPPPDAPVVSDLIRSRHDAELPTLLITNTAPMLSVRVSDTAAARVNRTVNFNWASLRGKLVSQ